MYTLVCTHPDGGLNCGTGAEYCNKCEDKTSAKQSNKKFGTFISQFVEGRYIELVNIENK